jgi:hypothetical protein
MAVAGSNDLIRSARGLHPLGKNKGLPPRRLVTVLGRVAFSIPSILPQPHDVGDLTGIFFSGKGWWGEGWFTGRMHDLLRNWEVIGRADSGNVVTLRANRKQRVRLGTCPLATAPARLTSDTKAAEPML